MTLGWLTSGEAASYPLLRWHKWSRGGNGGGCWGCVMVLLGRAWWSDPGSFWQYHLVDVRFSAYESVPTISSKPSSSQLATS